MPRRFSVGMTPLDYEIESFLAARPEREHFESEEDYKAAAERYRVQLGTIIKRLGLTLNDIPNGKHTFGG